MIASLEALSTGSSLWLPYSDFKNLALISFDFCNAALGTQSLGTSPCLDACFLIIITDVFPTITLP